MVYRVTSQCAFPSGRSCSVSPFSDNSRASFISSRAIFRAEEWAEFHQAHGALRANGSSRGARCEKAKLPGRRPRTDGACPERMGDEKAWGGIPGRMRDIAQGARPKYRCGVDVRIVTFPYRKIW